MLVAQSTSQEGPHNLKPSAGVTPRTSSINVSILGLKSSEDLKTSGWMVMKQWLTL